MSTAKIIAKCLENGIISCDLSKDLKNIPGRTLQL